MRGAWEKIPIYHYLEVQEKVRTTLSVKEKIKHSGLNSGLTLSVKEIISPYTDNW